MVTRIVEVVRERPEIGSHSPSFEPEAGLRSEAPKGLQKETLPLLGAQGIRRGERGAPRALQGGKFICSCPTRHLRSYKASKVIFLKKKNLLGMALRKQWSQGSLGWRVRVGHSRG